MDLFDTALMVSAVSMCIGGRVDQEWFQVVKSTDVVVVSS